MFSYFYTWKFESSIISCSVCFNIGMWLLIGQEREKLLTLDIEPHVHFVEQLQFYKLMFQERLAHHSIFILWKKSFSAISGYQFSSISQAHSEIKVNCVSWIELASIKSINQAHFLLLKNTAQERAQNVLLIVLVFLKNKQNSMQTWGIRDYAALQESLQHFALMNS